MRPYFFLGGNRGLTKLITGQFFYVNTEDRSITPWLLHAGSWELFVDDILCALARPGDVFVDVGANVGYYTVKIGSKVGPTGKVHSFEPNPETFGFLLDNVMINDLLGRCDLHQAAVGADPGEAWFSCKSTEPGGGVVRDQPVGAENETRVRVLRLDDVVPDGRADLIKIDVEGFEPQALRGMRGLLDRSPEAAVVVEMSYAQWAAFGDPITLLVEAAGGRELFRIDPSGRLAALPAGPALRLVLETGPVTYILMLPPSRKPQIAGFLGRDRAASSQLSRLRRLRNRFRAWLRGD
jgi:FkbM family methyltransferase